jgi:DNA-binding MarR family transcriptional regulator
VSVAPKSETAGADATTALGQAFKGAIAAQRRLVARANRPGELGHAQYSLLFGLCDGGTRSARELALGAAVSAAAATEMLEALEAAGLVRRTRSEHDRRVVLTSLTERGQELVEERRGRYEPRWRAALEDFSDKELRTAAAVLERLRELFDEYAELD